VAAPQFDEAAIVVDATFQERLVLDMAAQNQDALARGDMDLDISATIQFPEADGLDEAAFKGCLETALDIFFQHHPELRTRFNTDTQTKHFFTSEHYPKAHVSDRPINKNRKNGPVDNPIQVDGAPPIHLGFFKKDGVYTMQAVMGHLWSDGDNGLRLFSNLIETAISMYASQKGPATEGLLSSILRPVVKQQAKPESYYRKKFPPREVSEDSEVIQFAKTQNAIMGSEKFSEAAKELYTLLRPYNRESVRVDESVVTSDIKMRMKAAYTTEEGAPKPAMVPKIVVEEGAGALDVAATYLFRESFNIGQTLVTGHKAFARATRAREVTDESGFYVLYSAVSRPEPSGSDFDDDDMTFSRLKASNLDFLSAYAKLTITVEIDGESKAVPLQDYVSLEAFVNHINTNRESILESSDPNLAIVNELNLLLSSATNPKMPGALRFVMGDTLVNITRGIWAKSSLYDVMLGVSMGQDQFDNWLYEYISIFGVDDELEYILRAAAIDVQVALIKNALTRESERESTGSVVTEPIRLSDIMITGRGIDDSVLEACQRRKENREWRNAKKELWAKSAGALMTSAALATERTLSLSVPWSQSSKLDITEAGLCAVMIGSGLYIVGSNTYRLFYPREGIRPTRKERDIKRQERRDTSAIVSGMYPLVAGATAAVTSRGLRRMAWTRKSTTGHVAASAIALAAGSVTAYFAVPKIREMLLK
jgi:hypothetical protein